MAKRKGRKKTSVAGYFEKLSAQISKKIREELETSFKLMPSEKIDKLKKMLPILKKRLKNKINEELKISFRLIPDTKIKKSKKAKVKK